jgi:Holliday junction resolvasome RuvABC ATP-dependent DNA helicase subunit
MKTNIELSNQSGFNRAIEIAMVQNTPIMLTAYIDGYFDNIKEKEQLKETFKDFVNFKTELNKPCMFIEISKNSAQQLLEVKIKKRKLESFEDILKRVETAKTILKHIDTSLNVTSEALLKTGIERLYFDSTNVDFVIEVAKSICALDGKLKLEVHHIAEAIQYSRNNVYECIESIEMQIEYLKQERDRLLKTLK